MHHSSCLNAQKTSTHYSFPRFVYFYTEREKEQNVPQKEKLHVGVNSAGVGDANSTSNKKAAGGTSTSKKKAK